MLPPIPSWEGLHPIIVHFPIALLLIAPLFVLFGLFLKRSGKVLLIAAFSLMLIGTIAAFVAVSTGEAAEENAENVAAAETVLENHEELGEQTRNIFTGLTIIFALILFVPMVLKKELAQKIMIPVGLIFLLAYGAGTTVLLNTAHEGGRLVHEFGVRANMTSSGQINPPVNRESEEEENEDDEE